MKLFGLVALALPGCVLAFAAFASLSSARADVIYSTFGPGDSYGPACARPVAVMRWWWEG
jgi:hypothetical protein